MKFSSFTLKNAEYVASQTALGVEHPEVQTAQTYFRMQLVEQWQIPQGARILEIGCGQGDMTAVLAHAVGSGGQVTAVDIADTEYGSPVSLGEAAAHLKASNLGRQIDFRFQCDLLDPANAFDPDSFDFAVIAHSSWYFDSIEQFRQVLCCARPWANCLCYSEWDMEPRSMEQIAHLLSILIQGQLHAHRIANNSNARIPFSRTRLKDLLAETGWHVTEETLMNSTSLEDAHWEIDNCLKAWTFEPEILNLPPEAYSLLSSQVDTLRLLYDRNQISALHSYAIVAERTE